MDDFFTAGSEFHRLVKFQEDINALIDSCQKKYIKNYTNTMLSAILTCDFLVDGDRIRRAFTISEALDLILAPKEVKKNENVVYVTVEKDGKQAVKYSFYFESDEDAMAVSFVQKQKREKKK